MLQSRRKGKSPAIRVAATENGLPTTQHAVMLGKWYPYKKLSGRRPLAPKVRNPVAQSDPLFLLITYHEGVHTLDCLILRTPVCFCKCTAAFLVVHHLPRIPFTACRSQGHHTPWTSSILQAHKQQVCATNENALYAPVPWGKGELG